MRAVDTSAWAEWIVRSATGRLVKTELPKREAWLVPTIVQLELAKWAHRTLGADKASRIIAFSQKRIVVSLDTPIAVRAAALCREHKLATADAIVYATARAYDAELLTCDAHFKDLPNVTYIEKRA